MKSHNEKCDVREYGCAYCDKVLKGKKEFKEHVVSEHEMKFLQFFDSKLGAGKLKEEYERHLIMIQKREEEEEKKENLGENAGDADNLGFEITRKLSLEEQLQNQLL